MKILSLLLLVVILVGGCAPTCKNVKADEEYQMTFVDKMKILGGLFVAYLKDTNYEPREQRRYIIYDRWNNYLPIYDVVEVAPSPVSWRQKRDKRQKTEGRRQRAEDRGRRADDFGFQISDCGFKKTKWGMEKDSRQRAEDRGKDSRQRAEDRGQKER